MKIRTKISTTFLTVFIIVMVIIGFVMQTVSLQMIENQVISHLESVAQSTENFIDEVLEDQTGKLEIAATHSELSIEELKEIRDISDFFYEVLVLDSEGRIAVSSDESQIGKDKSNNEYFINGLYKTYIKPSYMSKTTGKESVAVSTPFHGGVLVARIELESFNKLVSDRTGLGETGESLLGYKNENEEIIFFTQRRFEEEAGVGEMKGKYDILPMEQALSKKEEVFIGSHDYRHIDVIAVTRYIYEINVGLVTKIDVKEAMAPTLDILRAYLWLIGIVLLIYFFIAWLLSRTISKPIEILRQGTEIIEQGNLNHKVRIETKDEIGQLSRAFDKMTEGIKKSRAEVDLQVKKQTGKITENAKYLGDQQKAILNILEDVEDEKDNVSKERDKINTILYSIGDGVFVVDKDMRITMFNQVAADITGFSIQEAQGKKYSEVLKFIFEDTRKINNKFIKQAMLTGEVQEMANYTLLITKDNKEIPVADSAAPLKDKNGKVIGCVVVFRDVTHERAVDQAKTEFVSLASHQLRTPLSAINWYAEMLLAGDAGKVNDEQKEYLDEIYKGNQRMVGLVNALLNVSRLELGTFAIDPEKTDLTKMVASVITELKLQADKKEQSIKINIEKNLPEIIVDPKLVRIIFQNLLSNAVKYTREKGKIVLKMEKLDKDLLVQITDNGMGIPKRQQSKMFEKLFRADNVRETDTEGTGLGLYIIKSILDNTGGKIWFESVENKGTTFSFTIPLSGMKKKEGNKELS